MSATNRKPKSIAPVADPRLEAIVRVGVHLVHELPGGVVILTRNGPYFIVEIHRNLKKSEIAYSGRLFAEAYGALLGATESEIIKRGGKLEEATTA